MSVNLVGLALLMAAVTYPFRALSLFAPTKDRLPPVVQRYLRLVGPGILAAHAAGNTAFAEDAAGHNSFHLGIEWIAVALGVVLIAWRGNEFVGIWPQRFWCPGPLCHGSLNRSWQRDTHEHRSGSTPINRRIRG